MMKLGQLRRVLMVGGLALAAAACGTSGFDADVTRFFKPDIPSYEGKTVTIKPAREDMDGLEFSTYAAAIGQRLGDLGFIPAGDRDPDIIAEVDYLFTPIATAERSGSSLSVGAGGFGRNVGVSGGVSFPVGERESDTAFSRRLDVTLVNEATGEHIWEGRAISQGREGNPDVIIPLLADALFSDFPGVSGKTVEVRIDPVK